MEGFLIMFLNLIFIYQVSPINGDMCSGYVELFSENHCQRMSLRQE